MSQALDNLRTEVEELGTVAQASNALLAGLSQQIRDNAEDPEALRQLAADLDGITASMSDAITANTPAQEG